MLACTHFWWSSVVLCFHLGASGHHFSMCFNIGFSQNISTAFHHTGRSGALMRQQDLVRRFGWTHNHLFWVIFVDQSHRAAELRTIIFSFVYFPPEDHWPWEHQPTTLNWDLYHFSTICFAVYYPCVTFSAVETPSVALSPASAPASDSS